MKFSYKGQEYTFPATLEEITLGQRIEYYNLHQKAMDEWAVKIQAETDPFCKELDTNTWMLMYAARMLSFYCDIPLEMIKTEMAVTDLLHIYNTDLKALNAQEAAIKLQPFYEWRGEKWIITSAETETVDKITVKEMRRAYELIGRLSAAGKGQWDKLPYLCAMYLRKEGEMFDESLLADGSERLALMLELPLSIALAVSRLLSEFLNIYNSVTNN